MTILPETKYIRLRRVSIYLLYILAFLAPLGALSRALTATSDIVSRGIFILPGPTTLIIVFLVAYGFISNAIPAYLNRVRIWVYPFIFTTIALAAGLFHPDYLNASIRSLMFMVYMLLMIYLIILNIQPKEMMNLILFASLGMTLMLFLSLIDYFGILNIPLINERSLSLSVEERGLRIKTLSGPFRSRSEMSAFLSVILPVSFGYLFLPGAKKIIRIVLSFALIMGIFSVVVGGSRAMYLALFGSFGYIIWNAIRSRQLGKITIFIPFVIGGIIAILIRNTDYLFLFFSRLGDISFEKIVYSEGDMIRWYAFVDTMKDLMIRPWGLGFTQFMKFGRYWDVHSVYTEFIRASGFIGIILLSIFSFKIFKKHLIYCKRSPFAYVFFSGFIGFLIYNIGHSYWQVSTLWIFMGCYFIELLNRENTAHFR